MSGGDDETRTRDLCRDSGTINGNCLKLRDTGGPPTPRKGILRTPKWTIIGPTIGRDHCHRDSWTLRLSQCGSDSTDIWKTARLKKHYSRENLSTLRVGKTM